MKPCLPVCNCARRKTVMHYYYCWRGWRATWIPILLKLQTRKPWTFPLQSVNSVSRNFWACPWLPAQCPWGAALPVCRRRFQGVGILGLIIRVDATWIEGLCNAFAEALNMVVIPRFDWGGVVSDHVLWRVWGKCTQCNRWLPWVLNESSEIATVVKTKWLRAETLATVAVSGFW